MAKWKPPHPAGWKITRNTCTVGTRYRTLQLLHRHAVPLQVSNLTGKLIEAECTWCQGFHLVNAEDLRRYRHVLVRVEPPTEMEKR